MPTVTKNTLESWCPAAVSMLRDAVVVVDRHWSIVFTNQAYAELSGQPASTLEGQSFWKSVASLSDFYSQETPNEVSEEALQRLTGEHDVRLKNRRAIVEIATRYVGETGQAVILLRNVTLERGSERQVIERNQELEETKRAMLNLLEDLNSEKEKLAAEIAKDDAILGSIGEGLVVTDVERRIQFMNNAAEHLTGYKFSELKGKKWPDVMMPRDDHDEPVPIRETSAYEAINNRRRAIRRRVYYVRKNRSKFPSFSTAAPILVQDKLNGAIVVFSDITREAEIDKAKTEFVSLASHQLRTPLSTIGWYTEMLLSGDAGALPAEPTEYLREIYQANRRMVDLVNALLNVSRIELGTFAVAPEPANYVEIAKTVVKEHQHDIAVKNLKVVERYQEIPVVQADRNLVRIIYQNLISNALKYSPPKGEVMLDVRTAKKGEVVGNKTLKHDSILSVVTDKGFGIPEEAQRKIFTKLFRADNVKEKDTTGTGLGLYIVKSIVDHAGGEVWFTSREGKGSTFFVSLPLAGMKRKVGARALT
jgi:PAS domain S-box-containing protein